jgi:glycosyltransferase involved in cell wall biosynthesis
VDEASAKTTRPLRILMSAYSSAPDRGSELGNGWNWPLAMARRGHEVTVLTTPRFRNEITAACTQIVGPLPRFEYIDEVEPRDVLSRLSPQQRVFNRYFAWQQRIVEPARALNVTASFDLVHHISWGSLQGGSRLGAIGVPLLFGPAGGGQTAPWRFIGCFGRSAPLEIARTVTTRRLTQWVGRGRAVAMEASMILAANEETAELARKLGCQRVGFFQDTGIRASVISPATVRDWQAPDLQVLWLGRMLPLKGVGLALKALAQVVKRVSIRLTLIGDGPESARLRRMATSLGIDRYLDWTGVIPWPEVIQALDRAHLLIFPSLRETGGAQLLEAMARGLPVLTLDHQGMRGQVPAGAGIKVPVRTPRQVAADLADAMEQLFHDRDHLRAMSAEGLRYARGQTWEVKADRMEEIYRELLRMHSPTASHFSNA